MISTDTGSSVILPAWSLCPWLFKAIITGLFVTDLTLSRIVEPQPGFFWSTTTTPFSVIQTAVLPPLNSPLISGCDPPMM